MVSAAGTVDVVPYRIPERLTTPRMIHAYDDP
jgi:hypothetical protein